MSLVRVILVNDCGDADQDEDGTCGVHCFWCGSYRGIVIFSQVNCFLALEKNLSRVLLVII